MEQKFLDNLDGGWDSIISNTYEESNKDMLLLNFKSKIHYLMKPSVYEEEDILFYANSFYRKSDIEAKSLKIIDISKVFDIKDDVDNYKIFNKSKQFTTTFSNILINNTQTYADIFKSFIKHPYPFKFSKKGELITINSDEDINNIQVDLTIGHYINIYDKITYALANNIIIGELSPFELDEGYTLEDIFNILDKYKD